MIGCHAFNIEAMASFHADKCCHLVSAHEGSARRICNSFRQFLISSTFALVFFTQECTIYNYCNVYKKRHTFMVTTTVQELEIEIDGKRERKVT